MSTRSFWQVQKEPRLLLRHCQQSMECRWKKKHPPPWQWGSISIASSHCVLSDRKHPTLYNTIGSIDPGFASLPSISPYVVPPTTIRTGSLSLPNVIRTLVRSVYFVCTRYLRRKHFRVSPETPKEIHAH